VVTTRHTRLQHWLDLNGFTSADLERAIAASMGGISRQSMAKIRKGADVRLSTIVRIKHGAQTLAQRQVKVEELFDFEPHDVAG
jgi:DNA-binding Xre family transcriptional regulator